MSRVLFADSPIRKQLIVATTLVLAIAGVIYGAVVLCTVPLATANALQHIAVLWLLAFLVPVFIGSVYASVVIVSTIVVFLLHGRRADTRQGESQHPGKAVHR